MGRAVLSAMRTGDDNATVAARLWLSPQTVRTYVSRILVGLHADSSARLVAIASCSVLAGRGS